MKTMGHVRVLFCLLGLMLLTGIGCRGQPKPGAPVSERTGKAAQRLEIGATEDFDGYADGDDLDGQNGGSGWVSGWAVLSGSVTLSSDSAFSGGLSAKFGNTSSDLITRELSLAPNDELDFYVKVPASLDAMAIIEIRSDWSTDFTLRFNGQTAGQVIVSDGGEWRDVGAFDPDGWNKVGMVMNTTTNKFDVYLNDALVANGYSGSGGDHLNRIIFESSTANGANVYFDSLQQSIAEVVAPPGPVGENFDGYADGASLDGQGGGHDWTAPWEVVYGTVTLSSDFARSEGSLSAKFGATTDDIALRHLQFNSGDEMDFYIHAPASSDAVPIFEMRGEGGPDFMLRFNELTPGQVAVWSWDTSTWTDYGAFVPDEWNKVGMVMNIATNKLDVYLNDVLLVSGVGGTGDDALTYVLFEAHTANGANVYFDSIDQVPAPPSFELFSSGGGMAAEDFDGYADGDNLDGQGGGSGWNSAWSVLSGSVSLSSDSAISGGLSVKFGATSSDIITRELSLAENDELDLYVKAPASADAWAIVEVRSDWSNDFMLRFNCPTVGQVSVYDAGTWREIGAFDPDGWNKVGMVMNATTNQMDTYLNDALVATGYSGMGGDHLTRIILESSTANGANVYFDSIQQVRP